MHTPPHGQVDQLKQFLVANPGLLLLAQVSEAIPQLAQSFRFHVPLGAQFTAVLQSISPQRSSDNGLVHGEN